MRTPIQEVYENFNKMSDADFKSWMLNTDLLKIERERMYDFTEGWSNSGLTIEDYYNKTFNAKEQEPNEALKKAAEKYKRNRNL